MLKTISLLILALIIIPVVAFYFDPGLSELQTRVLYHALKFMVLIACVCFIVGELTRNNSQIDKLWSILPICYTLYFAYASNWEPRPSLMAVLVAIWGIRLTYNFSRRAAYSWRFWSGEEDYRWQVLRSEPLFNKPWKWTMFNLFFICLYQSGLILLFTLPAVNVLQSKLPLTLYDGILACCILIAIAIEWLADQQQWKFQTEKYDQINRGITLAEPYKKGFITSGLWKFVRHPNYSAEQCIWILFYGFTIVAGNSWLNWSAVGFILLLLLFQGSADFSEKISASKYPEYKTYQKTTGKFIPKLGDRG